MTYLLLPGWGGSGPEHWQTRWETELPAARRVEVNDWFRPTHEDWIGAIERAIATADEPPVVIAHSLGCIALAHWAELTRGRATGQLAGALLVAPPDVELPPSTQRASLHVFAPVPRATLPFPSHVVASDDDPYASVATSRSLAAAWGSGLTVLRRAGHINAASNLGSWQTGRNILQRLVDDRIAVAA